MFLCTKDTYDAVKGEVILTLNEMNLANTKNTSPEYFI